MHLLLLLPSPQTTFCHGPPGARKREIIWDGDEVGAEEDDIEFEYTTAAAAAADVADAADAAGEVMEGGG